MEIRAIEAMIAAEDSHPWYQARLLLVKKVLTGFDSKNTHIMDFGCGSGAALETCMKHGFKKVMGFDTSQLCVTASQSRGVNARLIGNVFPVLDSKYDLILCLDVLEHLENDNSNLRQLKNLLNLNGKILITVPAHQFLWSKHDEDNHHFRRYSKQSLTKLVSDSQLQIVSMRYWNSVLFPAFFIQRYLSSKTKVAVRDEFALPPKFLRRALYLILYLEARNKLFGKFIGVSLVALLELPD